MSDVLQVDVHSILGNGETEYYGVASLWQVVPEAELDDSKDDSDRGSMKIPPHILPIILLSISNVFMTLAWYGHLKYKTAPLLLVILASWAIALFEYCLAVPANRWGHSVYSAAELKTIQEVITLLVFAGFSTLVLKEPLGWRHALGFALISLGAWLIFQGRTAAPVAV